MWALLPAFTDLKLGFPRSWVTVGLAALGFVLTLFAWIDTFDVDFSIWALLGMLTATAILVFAVLALLPELRNRPALPGGLAGRRAVGQPARARVRPAAGAARQAGASASRRRRTASRRSSTATPPPPPHAPPAPPATSARRPEPSARRPVPAGPGADRRRPGSRGATASG